MALAAPVHEMTCLEVWGGVRAVDTEVALPGLDAWVYAQPHAGHDAGGDVYYISSCLAGHIARLTVLDVSGHGISASEPAVTLRNLMRQHVSHLDQSQMVRALNDELSHLEQAGRFATAVLLTYYSPTRDLLVCNAGHPRPLWYRADQDRWTWLESGNSALASGPRNLPLGIIDDTEFEQFGVRLAVDDLIIMYTDAFIEIHISEEEQLGESGLKELVEQLTSRDPQGLGRELLARMAHLRGPTPPADDQTLIVIRHHPRRELLRPWRRAGGALSRFFLPPRP